MEDYVIDAAPVHGDYGKNLIAGALGPDAPFSRFSPSPTKSQSVDGGDAAPVHSAKTAMIEGPVAKSAGRVTSKKDIDPNDPIHQEKTHVGEPRRS